MAEALGDTGRILVRESSTEPLVRVMVEAPDHDTCQKYVSEVVDVIRDRGSKRKDLRQIRQSFKHRNSLSGMPLPSPVRKQSRMKIFKTSCRMNTTFSSKPNVGVTAICRRNGTSSYRSVLWEKAAKENVWKDSSFRTQREIYGTRKTPY